jgi:ABC-type transporter Mla MlaB component
MRIHKTDTMAHLEGNWTHTEITYKNIDSLSVVLEQIGSGCDKNLKISFERVSKIDAFGLQFLYIWLHCFKFQGIELELENLPNNMQNFADLLDIKSSMGVCKQVIFM